MQSTDRYRDGVQFSTALGLTLAAPMAAADVPEASGDWEQMAPLPEERTEVSVATDGERIFLAGGFKPEERARRRARSSPTTLKRMTGPH